MNILQEYSVLNAKVIIYEDNGIGYYKVSEPSLDQKEIELLNSILEYIYSTPSISNIEETVVKILKNKGITDQGIIEK